MFFWCFAGKFLSGLTNLDLLGKMFYFSGLLKRIRAATCSAAYSSSGILKGAEFDGRLFHRKLREIPKGSVRSHALRWLAGASCGC